MLFFNIWHVKIELIGIEIIFFLVFQRPRSRGLSNEKRMGLADRHFRNPP